MIAHEALKLGAARLFSRPLDCLPSCTIPVYPDALLICVFASSPNDPKDGSIAD